MVEESAPPPSQVALASLQQASSHDRSDKLLPNEMKEKKKKPVVLMYSDQYFHTLTKFPFHSQREHKVFALLRALGLVAELQLLAPQKASKQVLEKLFHAKEYIHFLANVNDETDLRDREAFGLVDDAYWFEGLFDYCQFVAGASITAAQALLHLMQANQQSAPVVINFAGGRHHAMRANASGFCYVNDVVLAIQTLLRKSSPSSNGACVASKNSPLIDRVVCVDLDIHHGDGVQEAFYFSDKVTTISFHLMEPSFFPGTGTLNEFGLGKGLNNNFNFPLKRGINDAQYTQIFNTVMHQVMKSMDPQVIVVVCGVDTLAKDPLGGFNLTSSGICQCIQTLLSFQKPILLFGGGGYHPIDAPKCHVAIVAKVLNQKLPDQVPEHEFYQEYCKDLLMATKPAIHIPNQNSDHELDKTSTILLERIMKKHTCKINTTTSTVNKKRNIDEL